MLITRRPVGSWLRVVHRGSGQVLWLRVHRARDGNVELGFDDAPRHFEIGCTPAAERRDGGQEIKPE